jgi:hypothetical protein
MSLVDFAQNSQPVAPGWQKLQDALLQGFEGKPALQAEVRRVVAEFAARADVPRRAARGAPEEGPGVLSR